VGALGKIGAAGPEQKLADILSEQGNHYTLRMQAARALGSLLAALSERDTLEQEVVEEPGVRLVTPEKTPREVLEQTVFTEDERVACAALEAMVEMDPDDAASSLVKILTGRWSMETPMQPGIGQDSDPETAGISTEDEPGDEIPQELVEMVTGRNAGNSTLAAILAAQPASNDASAEGEEDADEGESAPRQPQPGVRVLAARLLGNLPKPGPAAVEALIAACDNDDPELHREAIRGLGHSGDKAALEPILAGLGSGQENVRLAALDALGDVTGANSPLNKMAREDPAPAIRQRVVENMTSLRGPEVAEKLCRALEDEDLGVCRTALSALSRENFTVEQARQIEKLIFRFSCELRKESAAALRRMDDFSAASRLLDQLKDMEQESLHWGCIDALAEMYSTVGSTANNSREGNDP
jgi:HEAT repeat protein